MLNRCAAALFVVLVGVLVTVTHASADDRVGVERQPGRVVITVGGKPSAVYAYADPKVPRPSFVELYTQHGTKVTRNYPPQEGDQQDHLNHTGLFFTFGDLNGTKFWNLRGKEIHERFLEEPQADGETATFAVQNRYVGPEGDTYCLEYCRYTVRVTPHGVLVELDHTLLPDKKAFRVGSMEEGGLGLRVATPIAISSKQGGRMTDNKGRSGGDAIWGQQADWVDYSSTIDGHFVGAMVMPHPDNFSPCWWHARDYGLLGANPFGPLNSDKPKKVVRPGESLRLRYAVLVHSHAKANEFDPQAAYANFLQTVNDRS